jgi:hypothetical protein
MVIAGDHDVILTKHTLMIVVLDLIKKSFRSISGIQRFN